MFDNLSCLPGLFIADILMCHSSKDTKTNDINEGRISFFSHMVYVHEINMLISPSTLMFSLIYILLHILTLPELRLSWKEI